MTWSLCMTQSSYLVSALFGWTILHIMYPCFPLALISLGREGLPAPSWDNLSHPTIVLGSSRYLYLYPPMLHCIVLYFFLGKLDLLQVPLCRHEITQAGFHTPPPKWSHRGGMSTELWYHVKVERKWDKKQCGLVAAYIHGEGALNSQGFIPKVMKITRHMESKNKNLKKNIVTKIKKATKTET